VKNVGKVPGASGYSESEFSERILL